MIDRSFQSLLLFTFIVSFVEAHSNPLVSVCPGEGPRYGDYKCIHDRTHRVCAKLVDNSNGRCDALSWNSNGQSFWQITGQERWNWKDRICNAPNPGDSWCICLWATPNLIDATSLIFRLDVTTFILTVLPLMLSTSKAGTTITGGL